jgi:predicted Zn-dependent protease
MEISRKDLQGICGEYVEMRHSSLVHCDLKTQLGDTIQKTSEGVSLRVFDKGRLTVAHAPEPISLSDKMQPAEKNPAALCTPDPVHHYEDPPQPVDLPIEEVNAVLERFTYMKEARARLESLTQYEHIVTNVGTDVYHGSSNVLVRIFLTPVEGITLTYAFGYPGEDIIKGLEQLEDFDLRPYSQCRSISPGKEDVVLSPQVTGVIFHEVAHSLEGSVQGVNQFPSFISVFDHPAKEGLGSYTYDSEGCKTSRTTMVAEGELQRCLATVFEPGTVPPTGNGRASRFDVQPIPRQSNLEVYAHTDQCTEEELVEMINRGVYIAQVGSSSAFAGGVTYFYYTVAYRIEHGELTEPIRDMGFGGTLKEMVTKIECMGSDQKMEPFVCWKTNQRIFVTTEAPSSLMRGLPLFRYSSSKS